jgi:aminopeptidase
MDKRINKLSKVLVDYSTNIQPGEKVLIDFEGSNTKTLVRQLIKDVYAKGGFPYVNPRDTSILREILLGCSEDQLKFLNEYLLKQIEGMDAYISVRSNENSSELSDVPVSKQNLYYSKLKPAFDYRVNHTKWVVLEYPNPALSQLANMSQEAFEDFFFEVCTMDYEKMGKAMENLVALMEKTDKVQLIGPGTDLTFSIKGIPAILCAGTMNIPDGEVFTAPLRDSINGIISYNTPSEEQGFTFENIAFEFENGKIVKATSNNTDRINELLDTDDGARYVGEFAIGVNPYILEPMNDTLFDEKIAGSFHLTPGAAYEEAFNGNISSLHWDLVMIQRPEYGGGEIWFDDVLIRKDGIFVVPELECLNPENLK